MYAFYHMTPCWHSIYYSRESVCVAEVSVLLKQLNIRLHKQCHTIVQGRNFSEAEDLGKTQMGHLRRRRQMQVG